MGETISIADRARKGFVLGTTASLSDLCVTEGLGLAGLDFVWIDTEHTPLDKKDVCAHLVAAKAAGIASLVRVPWNDPVLMKPILDMGPDGVVVPYIRSVEEARRAIAAFPYPPKGIRGFGPLRASGYGTYPIAPGATSAPRPVAVFLQAEHRDCIDCLDGILALEGLDGIIVGPMDLSASYGKLGQLDDPALVRVMDELARKVVASGRILGISMGFDPGRVAAWIGRGVSLMSLGIDIEILIAGARNLRGAVDRQLAVPAPAGGRARAARRRPARKG
jgi:2-dehydro-3-deoxyglucarate aldolase/4-hydroxy-2-oxoheptanedioate aldolase